MPVDYDRIRRIFFPYTDERTVDLKSRKRRFVHYTSAETACRILQNRQLWMRGTSTMNDYLEVEHGFDCLNAAYKSDAGKSFTSTLNALHPNVVDEAVAAFNEWLPRIRQGTYIACFSEHLDEEDQHGRLSMWRAYGRNSGVALVINPGVMFLQNENTGLVASPVAYWTQSQVEAELKVIADRVNADQGYVRSLGREFVRALAFTMFRFAVLCIKHPGFAEEREWRVIASPSLHPSPLLTPSIEIVGGVPQAVQKLEFRDRPDLSIQGLEIRDVLNRVIIGPNEFPVALTDALAQLLQGAFGSNSVPDVAVSRIPVRLSAR